MGLPSPVSYTHLDVYKSQGVYRAVPVYFAPPQQRLWKVWVVYRIRQELRLKTCLLDNLLFLSHIFEYD